MRSRRWPGSTKVTLYWGEYVLFFPEFSSRAGHRQKTRPAVSFLRCQPFGYESRLATSRGGYQDLIKLAHVERSNSIMPVPNRAHELDAMSLVSAWSGSRATTSCLFTIPFQADPSWRRFAGTFAELPPIFFFCAASAPTVSDVTRPLETHSAELICL
jgi:hypothetical protein